MLSLLHLAAFLSLAFGTQTPVIGILTLPCYSEPHNCPTDIQKNPVSYVGSSYIKWLESAGARVIPILSDVNSTWLNENLLPQLNGVLFTGGGTPFNDTDPWWNQVNNILSFLREFSNKNDNQISIPLWFTCLGFEATICATAKGGTSVKVSRKAEDIPLPIEFTDAAKNSPMFNNDFIPQDYSNIVYNIFANNKSSQNAHNYGVAPSSFTNDEYLSTNFTLLGISYDIYNYSFATAIQSKPELGLNWYGTQFHPEKPAYVIDSEYAENCPHDIYTIIANQYLAQFFVNECRINNDNTINNDEYWDYVIYNSEPEFIAKINDQQSSYEELYVFPAADEFY